MSRHPDPALEAALETAKVRDVLPDGGEVMHVFDEKHEARAYAQQMNGLGSLSVYCAKQTTGRVLVLRYTKGKRK